MKTTYDKNATMPDISKRIAEAYQTLMDKRLGEDESLFLPDFPIEYLSTLNSAIITLFVIGIYTKADSVFGGAGVRIYPSQQFKNAIEKRVEDDWIAPRKGKDVWLERIEGWLNIKFDETAFYWNTKTKQVEIIVSENGIFPEAPKNCYLIEPFIAIAFMTEAGKYYRNGKTEPTEKLDLEANYMNVWVGHNQVVWNYDIAEDVVKEFSSRVNADYEAASKGSKGGEYGFEDAPLIAWLAYNAKLDKDKVIENANNTVNGGEVSEDDLDDL